MPFQMNERSKPALTTRQSLPYVIESRKTLQFQSASVSALLQGRGRLLVNGAKNTTHHSSKSHHHQATIRILYISTPLT